MENKELDWKKIIEALYSLELRKAKILKEFDRFHQYRVQTEAKLDHVELTINNAINSMVISEKVPAVITDGYPTKTYAKIGEYWFEYSDWVSEDLPVVDEKPSMSRDGITLSLSNWQYEEFLLSQTTALGDELINVLMNDFDDEDQD